VSAALLWPGRRAAAPPASTLAAASPAATSRDDTAEVTLLRSAPPASLRPVSVPPQEPAIFPKIAPRTPPAGAPSEGAPRPADAAPSRPNAATADSGLQLQAVSEQDGQPVAIVSGQLVRVGDRIGSATVVRIGPLEVELETAGQRHVLKF
jgi:hypothetical protein